MRKLLAIVLVGGALIVSASAAFADNTTDGTTLTTDQNPSSTGYWVDQQSTPFAPSPQAQ